MKIYGFDHVGITVKNLEESAQFYQDIMGFEMINPPYPMEEEEDENDGLAMIGKTGVHHRTCLLKAAEGHNLELMEFGAPESPIDEPMPMNAIGTHHISYQVDDIDEWIEKLTAKRVQFNYRKLPYETDKGTVFWVLFKDPNGVTVELMQQP